MEMETILLISDDSDADDSSNHRRRAVEEQDPLEGRRNLRKKKPKVNLLNFYLLMSNLIFSLILIDRK